MVLFITSLHILLCFILMLVILLQPGKGSDVGAAFGGGGGSSTIFGPRGAGSFLSKATTLVAVLFMVTSITLALYSNESVRSGTNIDDALERIQQERSKKNPAQPTLNNPDEASESEVQQPEPAVEPEIPAVEPEVPAVEPEIPTVEPETPTVE